MMLSAFMMGRSVNVVPPDPGTDPFWDDVVLLLHFDGDKADSGPLGLSPLNLGGHTIETSNVKFGSGSLNAQARYVNEEQYLRYETSILNFNSNPQWTIECWIFIPSSQSGAGTRTSNRAIANNEQWSASSGGGTPLIDLGAGTSDPPRLQMRAGNYGSLTTILSSATNVPYGQWVHVAFVRDGSSVRAYQDGIQVASGTYTPVVTYNRTGIGWGPRGSGAAYNDSLQGYMDEFRMTLAVRYTSNFTPPSSPFPEG